MASSHLDTEAYKGTRVLGNPSSSSPLIICFHGSGESCASWVPLAQSLSTSYRILLYDRGDHNPKPKVAVSEMLRYLARGKLAPPYVLVAHSYGGNFAREFLQRRPDDVVGMVLAETGQETALDPKLEKRQYQQQILGGKPLSVIRCNSLIGKWEEYEAAVEVAGEDGAKRAGLAGQKQLLDLWDAEDERLKKKQLDLSRNSRYIHVPDCSHHVIRHRPDVVAEEVRWVMDSLQIVEDKRRLRDRLLDIFKLRT